MDEYVILENLPARRSTRFRPQEFGAAAADTRVRVETLSPSDLASARLDPKFASIAPVAPMKLLAPLAVHTPASAVVWGIEATGAVQSECTGEGVSVAILDTGIDESHPALSGKVALNADFTGSGLGDRNGHGTHCAGTACGSEVDDVRIGVAPGVTRLLSAKILDDSGSGDTTTVLKGLQWALDNEANVIGLSVGIDFTGLVRLKVDAGWPVELATSHALTSYRDNLLLFNSFCAMVRSRAPFGGDALIVAAAGNDSRRSCRADFVVTSNLPAGSQGVISVGAVDRGVSGHTIAPFSNIGVDIAAPGVGIRSAHLGGALSELSGTSMACPHVVGIAALWWQSLRKRGLRVDAEAVATRLLSSARTDLLMSGFDFADVGAGLAWAPND